MDNESNDITLAQLIGHVEEMEENLRKKKEEVFQRVLDSLGGPMPPDQAILSGEAVKILQDSRMKREQRKREEQLRIQEEIEKARFEKDRERLRRRFDQGSEDAVGENPLADHDSSNEVVEPQEVWSDQGQIELERVLGVGTENEDQFEIILSELEKELDSQAVGKSEGVSEMMEVLQILDAAAANKKASRPANAIPAPLAVPLPPPPPPSKASVSAPSIISQPPLEARKPPAPAPAPMIASAKPTVATRRDRVVHEVTEEPDDESGSDDEDNDTWRKKRNEFKKHHKGDYIAVPSTSVEVASTAYEESTSTSSSRGLITDTYEEFTAQLLQIERPTVSFSSPIETHDEEASDSSSLAEEDGKLEHSEQERIVQAKNVVDHEKDSSAAPAAPSNETVNREGTMTHVDAAPASTEQEQEQEQTSVTTSGSLLGTAPAGPAARRGAKKIMMNSTRTTTRPTNAAATTATVSADSFNFEEPKPLEATSEPAAPPPLTTSAKPPLESFHGIKAIEKVPSESIPVEPPVSPSDPPVELPPMGFELEATSAPEVFCFPPRLFVHKHGGIHTVLPRHVKAEGDAGGAFVDLKNVVGVKVNVGAWEAQSDVPIMQIVRSIMSAADQTFVLVGCVLDRSEQGSWVLLALQVRNHIEADAAQELNRMRQQLGELSTASIGVVSPVCRLSEVITWLDSHTPADLLAFLEQLASSPLKAIPPQPLTPSLLPQSMVCVAKDYMASSWGFGVLIDLVERAELKGLRLVGFRSVCCLEKDLESMRRYSYDLSPSPHIHLCLAFASCTDVSASDVIREILGPESPDIAKRTDPNSLRALHGESRSRCLFFDPPHFREHQRTALAIYFGPRAHSTVLNARAWLSIPVVTQLEASVCLGVRVCSIGHDSSCRALAKAHRLLTQWLVDRCSSMGEVQTLTSCGAKDFSVVWTRAAAADELALRWGVDQPPNELGEYSLQCWRLTVKTPIGNSHVLRLFEDLKSQLQSLLPDDDLRSWLAINRSRQELSVPAATEDGSGGRYVMLQACRGMKAEDFSSHFAAGMCDVVVCSLQSKATNAVNLLSKLLQALSVPCATHVLSIRLQCVDGDDTVIATLRGWQLLECISDAVAAVMEAESSAMKPKIVAMRGRKALEAVISEFVEARDAVYLDICIEGLRAAVPWSGRLLQSATAGELSPHQRFEVAARSGDATGVYNQASAMPPAGVGACLFPPAALLTLHVVLLPAFALSGVVQTRRLSRLAKSLSRSGFVLVAFSTTDMVSADVWGRCWSDASRMHAYSSANPMRERIPAMPAFLMLVHGAGAGALRECLGPVLNEDFALLSYPSSLAAALAHAQLAPTKSASATTACIPSVLATVECSSTELAIATHFADFLPLWRRLQEGPCDPDSLESFAPAAAVGVSSWLSRRSARKVDANTNITTGLSTTSFPVALPQQELACVVICGDLWRPYEETNTALLSELLDALAREHIAVVNVRTALLSIAEAKALLQCAGQSSLTLRPVDSSALTNKPALCLGLCAPAHSLVRLNSLPVWREGNHPQGLVLALASSSARLGRELFAMCFDRAFATDCPYVIEPIDCA